MSPIGRDSAISRRIAWLGALVAALAAPVGVMAATPPGTAGGSGEIEISPWSQVFSALAPILGIAVVLVVLIGLGALVARIGGQPGAQKVRPTALVQFAVAVVVVGAAVGGVLLGREFIHELSVGGLGGAIGAGFVGASLVAIVVLLVGSGLIATKLRHGDISRTIRTMFIAAALLVAGAIGGGATAGLSGGLDTAPVVLGAGGQTSTDTHAGEPTSTVEPTAAPGPIDAAAVLQVTCDDAETVLAAPRVRVQPDGVHIHVTASSGDTVDVRIDDVVGMTSLGESIAGREGTLVETFGPGDYTISCGGAGASFTVVDPVGIFVLPDLPCSGSNGASGTAGAIDYAEGATGPRGSPLDVARLELRGLAPGDVVEHAGYPRAADAAIVRVVRDGEAVALLSYIPDGQGGWLIVETHACLGSGITVQPPV